MALIGYARVSTEDQSLDLQRDALAEYGCERVFEEKASGKKAERPQLEAMFDYLRPGDTVVVWKLDRLGRSLKDLINLTQRMSAMNVRFVSLHDPITQDDATGVFFMQVLGALAEYEASLISARTKAGLDAARARGRKGGRKAVDQKKLEQAFILYDSKTVSVSDICAMTGISQATFYKYNKQRREAAQEAKEQQ